MRTKGDPNEASRPTASDDGAEATCPRLREEDVERIADAVVRALKRERFIDDVARSLRRKLDET